MQVQHVSSTHSTGGSGTTRSCAEPAGVEPRDRYIATITYFNGTLNPLELSMPAGWTRVARSRHLLLALAIEIWEYTRGASPSGVVVATFSGTPLNSNVGFSIAAFRNVRLTTLLNASLLGDLLDPNVQLIGGTVPDNGSYLHVGVASQGSPGTGCSSSGLTWTAFSALSSPNGAFYMAPANSGGTGIITVMGGDASGDVCTLLLLSPERDVALTATGGVSAVGGARALSTASFGARADLATVGRARASAASQLAGLGSLGAQGSARTSAAVGLAGAAGLAGVGGARAAAQAALAGALGIAVDGRALAHAGTLLGAGAGLSVVGGARADGVVRLDVAVAAVSTGQAWVVAAADLRGALSHTAVGGARVSAQSWLGGGADQVFVGSAISNAMAALAASMSAEPRGSANWDAVALMDAGLEAVGQVELQLASAVEFGAGVELDIAGGGLAGGHADIGAGVVVEAVVELQVTALAALDGAAELAGEASVLAERPGNLPPDATAWPIDAESDLRGGVALQVQGVSYWAAQAAFVTGLVLRAQPRRTTMPVMSGRVARTLLWNERGRDQVTLLARMRTRHDTAATVNRPWSMRVFMGANAGLLYQGRFKLEELTGVSTAQEPRYLLLFDISTVPQIGELPMRSYAIAADMPFKLRPNLRFTQGCAFGFSTTPGLFTPAVTQLVLNTLGSVE